MLTYADVCSRTLTFAGVCSEPQESLWYAYVDDDTGEVYYFNAALKLVLYEVLSY